MRPLSKPELEQVAGGFWNDDTPPETPENPGQPPLPEPDTETPFQDIAEIIEHIVENPIGTAMWVLETVDGQETEVQQEAAENGHPCPTCHPPMP